VIHVTTNIAQGSARLMQRLAKAASQPSLDAMSREIAFNMAGFMRARIHLDGQDASGNQIGTYSPQYMRVRTDALPARITRGERKGDVRPRYKRTADTKVVLSLTSDMENDMSAGPIKTDDGYGIGFKNPHHYDKSQWNEATYKKAIFSLTRTEKDQVRAIAEDFINRQIGSI
jgi:hypothetical protein